MYSHRSLSSLGAALLLATTPAALLRAQTTPPTDEPPSLPGMPPAIPGAVPALPGTSSTYPNTTPTNRFPTRFSGSVPGTTRTVAPGTVPTVSIQGEENVRITYPDAPITGPGGILEHYAILTGKRVLPDNSVQGQISIVVNQAVPKSEAIRIIEVALNLNGFTLVQQGDNIVKVLGLGKQPRSEGLPLFFDLDLLPDSEQIVSYVARLRYLDPQETAGALTQYVPPVNRAAFTPMEKAGALIITDTATSVRRLANLVAQLDLPSAPVVEEFIRLERADASKALEFLNTVFDIKSSDSPTKGATAGGGGNGVGGNRRPIRRTGEDGQPVVDQPGQNVVIGGAGQPMFSGDSLIQGRITLTADVRTNRIHVVTSPVNMPLVKRLLEEYDADTPFASPVRYPLRFVSAKEVLPILVQALAEPGSDSNGGSTGSGSGSTSSSTGRTNINNGSTGSSNSSNNLFSSLNSSSSNGGYGSSGSGGSSSGVGDSGLDTPSVDTTPTISTVGNTKLIADQRSNTIIVLGGAEARDKVAETLRQLDVRPQQVVIRTVIGELSLGQNSELGFNYLLRSNRGSLLSSYSPGFVNGSTTTTPTTPASGDGTGTGTGTSAAATGSNLSNLTDLATGLAGVSSSFSGVGGILAIGKSFEIILSALESTNRFKTISRPMIFTSNNKKAIIASGQQVAVPTQSLTSTVGSTVGSAGIATNVDYKNVTLQLEVVPLINSEHEVTLDILQKIDSIVQGGNVTIGTNSVPTIATRYLKSTVSAPNNSTIVLGGLITQDEGKMSGEIPYLSKIPLLGELFRSRSKNADRSELIILMHPEVVNTPGLLVQAGKNEQRRTYLGEGLESQLLPNEVRKAIPVKQEKTVVKVKATKTSK